MSSTTKQYEKRNFIREYYGFVQPVLNELKETESKRERLDIVATTYLLCTTPGEEELTETTERRNYTIDLTDKRDPIFSEIAEMLEEMTPKIFQAIQIQESLESVEASGTTEEGSNGV